MLRRTNYTNKRSLSGESYQTPNYANFEPKTPLQVAAQPQLTFVSAFHKNIQIDSLDLDQTIATPEEVPPNAITTIWAILTGLLGQETSQINFYAEEPPKEQVVKTRLRARESTDLMMCWRPPKHNNSPAQLMLAFNQVLADLETKLQRQQRLLQKPLKLIVKRDWVITPKFNLCMFLSIHDPACKDSMTSALMYSIKQGNLLKTQLSLIIRPEYNNQMLRSLRVLHLTERADPALVDTLHARIMCLTGKLDQELKKLIVQQVIDLIRSKPEIMLPDWAQDIARKSTPETQLTEFFTIFKSVTATKPEFVLTTLHPLQLTSSTINERIVVITIYLPIHQLFNTIPDLTNPLLGCSTTEFFFTNDEPTINTYELNSTTNERKLKRLIELQSTYSTRGTS
ncbi:MAG: hypothetical protein EZS28_002157 [Streblomastix strix]|uniref:Uncharacterized protein n=1 Tax=Streblomastix strix TaxID=222440 RepID=A0A5J4X645_9EUKA|nr:MAG: hypothetical protein EZS28_002157 [Streblomastix strix]